MFNPLLMIDFYKSTHHEQYPVGLTKMVSYYTPRMSRLKDVDKVTLFGLQAFIKEYLIEGYDVKLTENYELTSEDKGTVWCLWDIFGGTINSKGYRVLDPHIKAIYGDSITPQRCARIYHRLENNGFAINNVSLDVGSFSFMCLEEDGSFNPYTRDTFGIAVKATYAEDANGKPIMIYKQPKALSWKKSQKGCCRVALDGQSYEDELTWADHLGEDNLLQPVFRDGNMIKEDTLHNIRARLYKEGF